MTPEELKQIRAYLGLTQSELARELRLRPKNGDRTVRAWELGEIPITGPVAVALEFMKKKARHFFDTPEGILRGHIDRALLANEDDWRGILCDGIERANLSAMPSMDQTRNE